MEKDQGSWLYHLQPDDGQFLNTNNISSSLFGSQRPNGLPANGVLSGFPYSGIPQSKVGQLTEQFGWSYCLPRFRQAFTSMQNRNAVERENLKESVEPNNPVSLQQKRFLVFDQSGDQTTLMFSSGIGNHVPCLASLTPKLDNVCAPLRISEGNRRVNSGHLTDECNEYHNDDTESEMHEDTEELNALLYSDDDSDCDYVEEEEEEETSTGHSPNIDSGEDEVASSVGQTVDEEEVFDDVQSVMDTANSGKRKRCFEDEQDAESYCTGGKKKKKKKKKKPQTQTQKGLERYDGRSKKEKIRETVGILQKIIPGSRGKDAIMVLDDAIAYLKALQCKAEADGFQIS